MSTISKWFPPFTGVIFVALVVAILILIGMGQDATEKTAQEIVNHYQDNNTKESIGSILIGFASVFILYFGGWLRRMLRDAEGPDGILSTVVFGAAVVFSAGAAIGGSIHLALADLADDIDPIALQAINGIDFDLFFFFPDGLGTMILATGISAVRHGSLPRWLAWVSVVVGVLFFSPVFWVDFVAAPLWILIVSIIGISRATRSEAAPATA
jgi:Na+-transporting methylmalonyl-CoA/oxaloacetate decarboxylase gamma subunit